MGGCEDNLLLSVRCSDTVVMGDIHIAGYLNALFIIGKKIDKTDILKTVLTNINERDDHGKFCLRYI